MTTLSAVLVGVGLFLLTSALLSVRELATAGPNQIDLVLAGDNGPDEPEERLHFVYRALEPLLAFTAAMVARISPTEHAAQIRRRIVYAGRESTLTVERMYTAKALSALVGLALGVLVHPGKLPIVLWCVIWAGVAFIVPDLWLRSAAQERQEQIGRDLPEALDLLAITVEAGLGLEQALDVVSSNLPGPCGDELTRLLREIGLGVPRREALAALRDRTDVPELSAFVVSLVQADVMGAAIADVLKVQAAQVRMRRRQRAREQAAKTPVKILFPVVFGVLPALFVVILGPAAITVLNNLIKH